MGRFCVLGGFGVTVLGGGGGCCGCGNGVADGNGVTVEGVENPLVSRIHSMMNALS